MPYTPGVSNLFPAIGPNTILALGMCHRDKLKNFRDCSAESSSDDSRQDAGQSDDNTDDQQSDSELDEDDDPLSGKTFDMSDGEGADDQSIPSEDDDSPDDSPPEAQRKAKALIQNGDSVSSIC